MLVFVFLHLHCACHKLFCLCWLFAFILLFIESFLCVFLYRSVCVCCKWACEWEQSLHSSGTYVCAFNNLFNAFTSEWGAHSYFSTLLFAHSFATWSSFATIIANKIFLEHISHTNFRLCFLNTKNATIIKKGAWNAGLYCLFTFRSLCI